MKCDRCDHVAVQHVAVREGGKTREIHLCDGCAGREAMIKESWRQAQLNMPKGQPVNVHDFIQRWKALSRSYGRELSKTELIQLLNRLSALPDDSHNPPIQRTRAAGIFFFIQKLLGRGAGR